MAEQILVTGGTGFIGAHLVRALTRDGHRVRVITRSTERARAALPPGTELVEGDVADPAVVHAGVAGCDVVYHLASTFREAKLPDSRHRAVHVEATRLLLERARAEGVRRFVHCSTIGVHGHVERPPADERAPFGPGDIYQETKLEGELLARRFQRERGLPVTVVRPGTVYGPGDLRFLKMFRMIAKRRYAILGRGEVCLHFVHVDDLVRGMRLAADHPDAVGEVFIIAGDEARSQNEMAALVAEAVGAPPPRLHLPIWPFYVLGALTEAVCVPLRIEPPIYRRRVAFFMKNRAFTIEKARRMLGYEPRVELRAGLRETAEWYRAQGLLR